MAAITSAASGNWGTGATWVGGVVPVVGDKVTIAAGHVVTVDGTYTAGDDTSSLTAASNAITVNGTLKFSRSVNSSLTCRGTLFIANNGTFDMGDYVSDPITSVNATLIVNDSAVLATGKHGIVTNGTTGTTIKICGAQRTRNTNLTSGISGGATSITVDNSVGWAVGDRLVIASDTDDYSRSQVVTISGGSSPTWTVSAITNARSAACRVGNLSSNVVLKSMSPTSCGFAAFIPLNIDTTGSIAIQDVRFEDMGDGTAWVGVSPSSVNFTQALTVLGTSIPSILIRRAAFEGTTTTARSNLGMNSSSINRHTATDCAIYTLNTAAAAMQFASGSAADINAIVYRAPAFAVTSSNSDGSAGGTVSGEFWCGTAFTFAPSVFTTFNNTICHTTGNLITTNNGKAVFNGGTYNGLRLQNTAIGTSADVTFNNCNFSAGTLSASNTTGNKPSQSSLLKLISVNGVATDNRVISYYQTSVTDTVTKNRGSYSVKIAPQVANLPINYTFAIPCVAGVAQRIIGYLRFDTTYGTATPPSITFSGQGVSQTFTAAATANTWQKFDFAYTPTNTGDITATVTVQSTSTAGFAWLDGVYHYPMIQSTKHYGFLYGASASLTVDPVVQASEAVAGAYTGIAYSAGTLTISATHSIREIYDWLKWYEATNQVSAIITSSDGVNFTLSANITLSGGNITGTGNINIGANTFIRAGSETTTVPITYSSGAAVFTSVTITGLVANSRLYLSNTTDSVNLYNAVVAGTSVSVPVTWTADKTIRLRVQYTVGTSSYLPYEASGILTNSGASFLVAQVADTVYNTNAINGSTVTEFVADYPNVQVDISDPDGVTTVQRLYAWFRYNEYSASGIEFFQSGFVADDLINYQVHASVINLMLDNRNAAPVIIVGARIYRDDGSTIIYSGSNSIQLDPAKAYLPSTTVVSANIKYVNDVQVKGTGTASNPWNPV